MDALIHKLTKEVLRIVAEDPEVVRHLHELREHHLDSYSHSRRVATWAVELGIDLELPLTYLILLAYGGNLHDLGKKNIPVAILNYPGKLSGKDQEIMDHHPTYGFEMLHDFKYTVVAQMALRHQEFQGRAYPRSFVRDPYSVESRLSEIIAVADMFDGLKYRRAYKPEFSRPEIERIMKQESTANPEYIGAILSLRAA